MNEIQKNLLDELIEFDRIAKSINVSYTLHGGTLLGSIREKGFIKWDNDADIAILSKDYPLIKQAFEKNSENYKIIDDFTAGSYEIVSVEANKQRLANTDIFIFDYISENWVLQKIKILGIIFFQAMLKNKNTILLTKKNKHKKGQMILYYMGYYFGKLFKKEKKEKWYHNFCTNALVGKKKMLVLSNDTAANLSKCIPVQYAKDFIEGEFEGYKFMITAHYHELLKQKYGDNYLTPFYDEKTNFKHQRFQDMLYGVNNKE